MMLKVCNACKKVYLFVFLPNMMGGIEWAYHQMNVRIATLAFYQMILNSTLQNLMRSVVWTCDHCIIARNIHIYFDFASNLFSREGKYKKKQDN